MAAVAGCAVGIIVTEPFNWAYRTYALAGLYPAQFAWLHGTAALFYHPIFQLTHWLLLGGAAVFLYANRRAARRTSRILHEAELDRIHRSKLALESRLRAMQARVEPQFLFNTLSQVEQLYEREPARGGQMLDDLIAYLHAAMPRMRDTSSSVGQEVALVRAYLEIVQGRVGVYLAVSVDVPREAEAIRMPPMMLLPLAEHAVSRAIEHHGERSLRIAIDASGTRLVVRIADSGPGFAPEHGGASVAEIRSRLAALYGGDATLNLDRGAAGSSEAVLDIPIEAVAPASGDPVTASTDRIPS
jgi:LytS/YehU family sensor histidine kinase